MTSELKDNQGQVFDSVTLLKDVESDLNHYQWLQKQINDFELGKTQVRAKVQDRLLKQYEEVREKVGQKRVRVATKQKEYNEAMERAMKKAKEKWEAGEEARSLRTSIFAANLHLQTDESDKESLRKEIGKICGPHRGYGGCIFCGWESRHPGSID